MIIPYKVDVDMPRLPLTNYLMMVCVTAAFAFQATASQEAVNSFVLKGWSFSGLLGYMWLHGGYLHIIGNLLFMWVFGNAVCAKVGDGIYPVVYVLLGVAAGVVQVITDGRAVVGASGAVYGLIGMYLMIYPLNDIKCLFFIIILPVKRFRVAGIWVISWWMILNFCGHFFTRYRMISYTAHIGGFAAGIILGGILLKLKFIKRENTTKIIAKSIMK